MKLISMTAYAATSNGAWNTCMQLFRGEENVTLVIFLYRIQASGMAC